MTSTEFTVGNKRIYCFDGHFSGPLQFLFNYILSVDLKNFEPLLPYFEPV